MFPNTEVKVVGWLRLESLITITSNIDSSLLSHKRLPWLAEEATQRMEDGGKQRECRKDVVF